MDSSYNSDKKARGVYQDDIYFGSISENKLYNVLLEYRDNYLLGVHHPLTISTNLGYKWKVDFTLRPNSYAAMESLRKLLYICNEEIVEGYIEEVYIEYKGWNDQNFLNHMQHIRDYNPDILSKLVLVSDKPSAFINENLHNRTRYKKLITSLRAFTYWINDVF